MRFIEIQTSHGPRLVNPAHIKMIQPMRDGCQLVVDGGAVGDYRLSTDATMDEIARLLRGEPVICPTCDSHYLACACAGPSGPQA